MGAFHSGDYWLTLEWEFDPKTRLWCLMDKSLNYPVAIIRRHDKPTKNQMRRINQYAYWECRQWFDFTRDII